MTELHALLLGLIEGLTEFLPISSTGHLILVSHFLGLPETDFQKSFEIAIQLGAIGAVLSLFWRRLIENRRMIPLLAVAFVPTGVIGFFAYSAIKTHLFTPMVVAGALIVGGVVLIVLDRFTQRKSRIDALEKMPVRSAVAIGFFQCLSMIPGTSRAAATIIGGVALGLDRRQAAEFSFLLALPTMAAATGYDLLKTGARFSIEEWSLLAIGAAVAFVSAFFAIRWFIEFLVRHGFWAFGVYRIFLGVLFLVFLLV